MLVAFHCLVTIAFGPSVILAALRDHPEHGIHLARKSRSLCRANYATCSCVSGEHFRLRAAQGSSNAPPTAAAAINNWSRERQRGAGRGGRIDAVLLEGVFELLN